mgnify:CR=1 FL=1
MGRQDSRHRNRKNEEEEWEDRVMRMSDDALEMEDDITRAKIDPEVEEHRAMSEQDREKTTGRFLLLKWAKRRLDFTKQERESRRLSRMSDEDLETEIYQRTGPKKFKKSIS